MNYDVIVVGAGLSGLAVAIRLQQQGKSVLVLEKTDRPGGRAKTVTLDGLEFEIGSNQVGKGIHAIMDELGIQHEFIPLKNRFIFSHDIVEFPLTQDSADTLPELTDYLTKPENSTKSLGEFTSNLGNTARANILRAPFSYFLIRSSEEIDLSLVQNFLVNEHGSGEPRAPLGGVSTLVANMVKRFQSLGGLIHCNATYHGFVTSGNLKTATVKTKDGQLYKYRAKDVISSVDGWHQYPQNSEKSPSIGSILFEMNADFRYPEGVHTMVFVPDDIDSSVKALKQGEFHEEFAFHCFKNRLLSTEESSSPTRISAYVLWPCNRLCTSSDRQKIEKRMVSLMSKHLPGFEKAIVKQHFFPPESYTQSWGFESVVVPRIPPKGFTLSSYDADLDIYYVGNAVNGEYEQHIGGALASTKKAADLILKSA